VENILRDTDLHKRVFAYDNFCGTSYELDGLKAISLHLPVAAPDTRNGSAIGCLSLSPRRYPYLLLGGESAEIMRSGPIYLPFNISAPWAIECKFSKFYTRW